MKTRLIGLLLIASAGVAFGQKMDLEFLVGPSLVSLRGNDVIRDYHKAKVSFSTGVGFNYYLTPEFSLGLKFLYEGKGSRGEFSALYYDEDGQPFTRDIKVRTNFDYLSLPITARYSFGNKIRFCGEAGTFVSYLLKQTESLEGLGTTPMNRTGWFRQTDIGVSFGVSASFPMTKKVDLSASLLDNIGLVNISSILVSNNETIKTNSLIAFLGITYRL